MAAKTQAIPKGYHTVTPSMFVAGAAKALDFYKKAFGAEEVMRFPGPNGTIMHGVMKIGDSLIMIADEMPAMGGKSPRPLVAHRSTSSSTWTTWMNSGNGRPRAGGKTVQPLADQFWGDRAGCLEDPFGHSWWLAQHVKDMSQKELEEAAESAMSHAGAGR